MFDSPAEIRTKFQSGVRGRVALMILGAVFIGCSSVPVSALLVEIGLAPKASALFGVAFAVFSSYLLGLHGAAMMFWASRAEERALWYAIHKGELPQEQE